jgi:hypothetical protein
MYGFLRREEPPNNSTLRPPGSYEGIESLIYVEFDLNRPIYPPKEEFVGFKVRLKQKKYAMLIWLG